MSVKNFQRSLFLFFAAAPDSPTLTCRQRWLSVVVKTLTRSELTHVAVGIDGVVLDPTVRGNRFWPIRAYAKAYPRLKAIFEIQVDAKSTSEIFRRYEGGGKKPAIPTFIRWATGGRWPWTTDCVCIAIDVLRSIGIDAPRRIVSPQALFDWLDRSGFHHVEILE